MDHPSHPFYSVNGFQHGDHVALARDPSRRGIIVDVVSTWRSVRWSGRGSSNHRPGELIPIRLTDQELGLACASASRSPTAPVPPTRRPAARRRREVDPTMLLQQMLDEEIVLKAENGEKVSNIFIKEDGTPGRQLVARAVRVPSLAARVARRASIVGFERAAVGPTSVAPVAGPGWGARKGNGACGATSATSRTSWRPGSCG